MTGANLLHGQSATVTLAYNEEETDYDIFDLATGNLVFTTVPKVTVKVAAGLWLHLFVNQPNASIETSRNGGKTWKLVDRAPDDTPELSGVTRFTVHADTRSTALFRARID